MKHLLFLMVIVIIGFQPTRVTAGTLDGKGLSCKQNSKHVPQFFIWFENSAYSMPKIMGHRIYWTGGKYREFGKETVLFTKIYKGVDDWPIAGISSLNRRTLVMKINSGESAQCKLVPSKNYIIEVMNEILSETLNKNKI